MLVRGNLARCTGILGTVDLAMALENDLGIKIPDREWSKPATVADVVALVSRYVRPEDA